MNHLEKFYHAVKALDRSSAVTLANMLADAVPEETTEAQRRFREDVARVVLAGVGLKVEGENPRADGIIVEFPPDLEDLAAEVVFWRGVEKLAVNPKWVAVLEALCDTCHAEVLRRLSRPPAASPGGVATVH